MTYSLWDTLIRPDLEEKQNPEKTEFARAANYLGVGEFQLLQLAYKEWFGEDLPEALVDRLFHTYMLDGDVPHWARHYARQILRLDDNGRVNENDPRYHVYDADYQLPVEDGPRKFYLVSACLMIAMCGGVLLAAFAADESTTVLPPYFDRSHLQANVEQAKPQYDGFGRADSAHPRPGP